jgi:hypothetical protein
VKSMSPDTHSHVFSFFVKIRHLLQEGNPKYALIVSMIMYMVVILSLVSFSEINLYIFAGDLLLLVTAVLFAQEIRKVIRNGDSKELLRSESPLNWLKFSTITFVFSVLSSLAYGIANPENLGLGNNPIMGYLLLFSVGFFLLGLFYTVRIIWFTIDPSSRTNILVGKAIRTTTDIGFRLVILASITVFQVFNGIMLYLFLRAVFVLHLPLNPFAVMYIPTLILSFIAMLPLSNIIIFHIKEQIRFRGGVVFFCFFSPWIILIGYSLLLTAGIV